jgi:hypothetical protein
MVPFRPEGGKGRTVWREVKVAVLARLGRRIRSNEPQLHQRRLVSVLGGIDFLRPRLWLEALRQGVLTAPRVVWLSDGGVGFWGLYAAWFAAYAIGILDFYHAVEKRGLMDVARRRVCGLLVLVTDCDMVRRM